MSDLQTKLGSGMNKLQEGIEQGKMKLQVAQEIAQLKKGMQVQMQKKAEFLSICSSHEIQFSVSPSFSTANIG
ncbi:hypothetical protein ACT453_00945, partial [Bacillus sp. D-CC]